MQLIKFLFTLLPHPIAATLSNYRTLSVRYGQYRSIRQQRPIDAQGSPIPWYTYPAIEYLKQFDFSQKTAFEFGTGNSTLFWASRCKRVVAVEDNPQWYDELRPSIPHNVELLLAKGDREYVSYIESLATDVDIIVIDGSHREECAHAALSKLAHSGFIILDNSDWYCGACRTLRDAGLLQIDMSGFGPMNGYTFTTSLFFRRDAEMIPLGDSQPHPSLAAIPSTSERP